MAWKVWLIPGVIVVFSVAGLVAARHISLPTLVFVYDESPSGETSSVKFTVDGLHCYGTADFLRQHISGVPGLVSIVAYGGRHRVVVEYDPALTVPAEIREAIEAPVETRSGMMSFFRVTEQRGL